MPRFGVKKHITFDAGHRVPDHGGKCFSPHGHTYKLELHVKGNVQVDGVENGMVLDFTRIKEILTEIHDMFDHASIAYEMDWPYLVSLGEANYYGFDDPSVPPVLIDRERGDENRYGWKVAVVPFVPTAENLALWCFEYATNRFKELNLPGTVTRADIWETPTSMACFPVNGD
jgi:queuosine biosynthesis protein QueD